MLASVFLQRRICGGCLREQVSLIFVFICILYLGRYEHEVIQKIVEEVSRKINRSPLHVANYPIGLESRVQEVNSLLDVGSNQGVSMVGIYGIGEIGKIRKPILQLSLNLTYSLTKAQ